MPNEDNDGTFAVETRGLDAPLPTLPPPERDGGRPSQKSRPATVGEDNMAALSLQYARTRDPQMRERLICTTSAWSTTSPPASWAAARRWRT